jgi:hypothetical protein
MMLEMATAAAFGERDGRGDVKVQPRRGDSITPEPALQRRAGAGGDRTRGGAVVEAVPSEPPSRPSAIHITRSVVSGKAPVVKKAVPFVRAQGYRFRTTGTTKVEFVLPAIAQCGINVAASVASVHSAPKVVEALILAETFHSSLGFDRSLLVPREFNI